ncbi:MAG: flagellar biosynthesis anti-sigma factor FlgM [Betaproteobacteria bacterium]|jgi:flagellar biosynthesis anti-sigma factor FlgM
MALKINDVSNGFQPITVDKTPSSANSVKSPDTSSLIPKVDSTSTTLSSQLQSLQAITTGSAFDVNKVSAISNQIAKGNFQVNSSIVADNLISYSLGLLKN